MERAYSLLQVKGISEDSRTITGIATTPDTDRMGDIVETLGIQFKNPLALLWQHKHDQPVGHAQFNEPTKKGISFTAQIAVVDEPGPLKSLVDMAWQSVKANLVRGVSIGFRAIDYAVLETGGIHWLKTEVIELSLVTIPANASASIQSIKTFDRTFNRHNGSVQLVRIDYPNAPLPKGAVKLIKPR